MRLWETGGQSGEVEFTVKGYRKVIQTDLLERDQEKIPIIDGKVKLNINAHSFVSLRFISF
jgi:hypothetical protein